MTSYNGGIFWTPGNVHNVEYGTLILVSCVIELKFNIYKRINARIGDFFGRPLPTAWVLSSPVLAWFWLSLILFVKFNANLLNLRVVNALVANGLGQGHWFAWLTIAAIVTRWGWNDLVGGFLIVGLYSALHEAIWYVFYYATYPAQLGLTWLFYLPFGYLGLCLSIGYVLLSNSRIVTFRNRHYSIGNSSISRIPRQTILQMLSLFIITDIMWAMAGFPVTIRLDVGATPQFPDLSTNLIEDNSWVVPAVPLILSKKDI